MSDSNEFVGWRCMWCGAYDVQPASIECAKCGLPRPRNKRPAMKLPDIVPMRQPKLFIGSHTDLPGQLDLFDPNGVNPSEQSGDASH